MKPTNRDIQIQAKRKKREAELVVCSGGVREKGDKEKKVFTVCVVNPSLSLTGSWDGLHLIWTLMNKLQESLRSSREGKRRWIFLRAQGHMQLFDTLLRSKMGRKTFALTQTLSLTHTQTHTHT